MLAAALLASAPASATPSATGDPLVGQWRYGDGTVRVVRHGNGSFTGTVVAPLRFAACTHPAGEPMWRLWGGNGRYSGRQLSFGARPGCGLRLPLAASIRVDGRALELRVARRQGVSPGACGGLTDCFRLTRIGPAPAAPAAPPAEDPGSFEIALSGRPSSGAPADPAYTGSSGGGWLGLDGTGNLLLFDSYRIGSRELELDVRKLVGAAGRSATAEVAVRRSTVPGCARGATGVLRVRAEPDRVDLLVCGLARAWTRTAQVTFRQAG